MKKHKDLSWEDIKTMFAETDKKFQETDKKFQETDRLYKETDKRFQETDRKFQETDKKFQEADRMSKETDRMLTKLGHLVGGMANSNGEMAEDYFYSAFKADKTFANEKFDKVKRNLSYNNGAIEAEFDIVLFNGKSAALIEVKYNAKPNNISVAKIISRIEIFKILFPEYQNFNIYLGVAAMSFKKGLESELHQAGIATIKQIGKKMVLFDKNVKVF